MTKLKRLDILFLLTGSLFLIMGFLMSNQTLDINVHDTYFVISFLHIGIFFFVIHALFSLIYFIIRRLHKYLLGLLHLILQTPIFFFIFISSFVLTDHASSSYYQNADTIYAVLIILFFLGQLFFLTNIVLSIVKAIKQRTRN
jgi:heme/copper-type cytochrome/quinol oxidase subunit 1